MNKFSNATLFGIINLTFQSSHQGMMMDQSQMGRPVGNQGPTHPIRPTPTQAMPQQRIAPAQMGSANSPTIPFSGSNQSSSGPVSMNSYPTSQAAGMPPMMSTSGMAQVGRPPMMPQPGAPPMGQVMGGMPPATSQMPLGSMPLSPAPQQARPQMMPQGPPAGPAMSQPSGQPMMPHNTMPGAAMANSPVPPSSMPPSSVDGQTPSQPMNYNQAMPTGMAQMSGQPNMPLMAGQPNMPPMGSQSSIPPVGNMAPMVSQSNMQPMNTSGNIPPPDPQ